MECTNIPKRFHVQLVEEFVGENKEIESRILLPFVSSSQFTTKTCQIGYCNKNRSKDADKVWSQMLTVDKLNRRWRRLSAVGPWLGRQDFKKDMDESMFEIKLACSAAC
ncbi:hypothetical protein CDAR_613601 [Caerostris darwini]|uniref:Uncharacterized protein n=1 Tax=Caerostris darwini TaxID=1538125 RepID=A0AAV4RVZ6_9ARAC|nr:hypothetical protein CDAR_613601 [Caerostris darwini]